MGNDMDPKYAAVSAPSPKANLPQDSNEAKIATEEVSILTNLATFFQQYWMNNDAGLPAVAEPDKLAQLIKTVLCSYACKELAMADVFNALACKVAVDKGLIKGSCDCECGCLN